MVQTLALLCYKYHFGLPEVLALTLPQIELLKKNLEIFVKAENGVEDKENKSEINTRAFDDTLKILQKRTGRNQFTIDEVMNPGQTLKKYKVNYPLLK